ncbi:hypothetical protein D3C86_1082050 [compost metagenome]
MGLGQQGVILLVEPLAAVGAAAGGHDVEEGGGIVVIPVPGIATDPEIPFVQGRDHGLPLHVVELGLDPQVVFPHGGDGQRYLLVPLVGVVEDVHIQRILRPVARLGEQRLGLFDPRLLAHQLAGWRLELEAIDARRGQAERRELPLSQDLLRDGVSVDGKGERLAHPDVVEGFALGVEHVVVGGEHGGAHQIVRALALDLLILLQGIGGVVQFARAIAVVGRGIGDDFEVDHLVQHCVLIVPSR